MGYRITRFASTDLPARREMQDAITGRVQSSLVRLPGGKVFDAHGTETAIGEGYPVKVGGAVHAATPAALKTAVYALRALKGVQDKLYRTPDGGSANSEWVEARCDNVESIRDWRNRLWENVVFYFTVLDDVWSGAAGETNITLDASPKSGEVTNSGNAVVRDLTITIAAEGTAITQVDIENLETGHVSKIRYSGSITAGQSLVIDCGALSVKNNAVDDWDNLSIEAAHEIDEWLRLMPGNNTIRVTRTGGGATSVATLNWRHGYM